jgi:uncharacterized protein with HEPN domain
MRDYRPYLNDIVAAIESIEAFVEGVPRSELAAARQRGISAHSRGRERVNE